MINGLLFISPSARQRRERFAVAPRIGPWFRPRARPRPSIRGFSRCRDRRAASVLVGLLWCVALLSVVVLGVLHTATLDLRVVKNHGDAIQARYLALAGIEKAKALLYHDAANRKRSAQNHSGELYDASREFREVQFGRGEFSVLRQGSSEEPQGIVFGVADEESRLNVNHASSEELNKLYEINPAVVAAIVDYRDEDNRVSTAGAESDYYVSLQPPYLPRNAPIATTRELLMIRGVSRELLFGEDANQNGILDPEEDDGGESDPPDNRDGLLDAGWSGLLTCDSAVRNINAAGQERVNVQTADENSLTQVRGISMELAKAIVAYRGQNRLENLVDLLEVKAMSQPSQPPPQPSPTANRSGAGGPNVETRAATPQAGQPASHPAPQPTGPNLISEDLFMEIADDVTTVAGSEQPGAVNINTASVSVLMCLPGITRELAHAIVSHRKSAGFFPNVAWLLKVPGMNREILKQVAPRVTTRSETFRILSEGKIKSTATRKRIQVIVRVKSSDVETLAYREDL